MTNAAAKSSNLVKLIVVAIVVVLVAAAAGWWMFSGSDRKVTAYFTGAVGLYPGGDVRILGVPVGTIDEVTPQGKQVRVVMSVHRDVNVPANASAVAVSPSVVSDRYVQLAPVYKGGPTMQDGAVIPEQRTATPVELDSVYRSLNQLTTALGPNGANKNGALSDLLNTGAANLKGNGEALSETMKNLGEAGTTMSGNSKQLFDTVDNLQRFTSMLAQNDGQVRQFNTQMDQVSGELAGERSDMSAALAQLAQALGKVEGFIKDNRAHIKTNVDQLNSVATVLVKQKKALQESLVDGPLAMSNLNDAYNGASGTLDTRALFNELNQPPLLSVCKLLSSSAPTNVPKEVSDACSTLGPLLNAGGAAKLPTLAETMNSVQNGKLPPLPLPLTNGTQPGGGQ